jgi:hypothetical protein
MVPPKDRNYEIKQTSNTTPYYTAFSAKSRVNALAIVRQLE